jgi:long-chain acyl-CoA synthetase
MDFGDSSKSMIDLIDEIVRLHGRRKFLTFEKKTYTYREVNRRMNQVAHGFRKLGITRGSRIALLLANSPEYIFTYFGMLKLGAINVPINTFLTAEEIEFILNDCEVSAIVVERELYAKFQTIFANLPSLQHIIVTDAQLPGTIYFGQFDQESPENPAWPMSTFEDIAVIHYTSGTTGKPKGAMLSHKNLLAAIDSNTDVIRVSHRDRVIVFLPLFHVFTFVVCILAPFSRGTRLILLRSVRQFKQVRDTIVRYRISVLVGIPQVFAALANAEIPWFFKYINPIRVCVTGGSALNAEVLTKFEQKFRIPLLEGYGLSETTGGICVNPMPGPRKPMSVGPAIKGVQVQVIDEDGGVLGPNEVGELLIKANNVMAGYYKQPEATKEVLHDDWFHTGDMVKIDADGYIYIVDRKKDMLIVRGMNVYPREVEDILNTHPKVAECAVIGVPDKQRGEVPKAIIALKKNETATEKEFRKFCHEKIAMYKNPKYFEFRESLPKTPTGKVMKKVLKQEEFERLQHAAENEMMAASSS